MMLTCGWRHLRTTTPRSFIFSILITPPITFFKKFRKLGLSPKDVYENQERTINNPR